MILRDTHNALIEEMKSLDKLKDAVSLKIRDAMVMETSRKMLNIMLKRTAEFNYL